MCRGPHDCPLPLSFHVLLLLQFEASLKRELKAAQEGRAGFVDDFSEKHYDAIVGGWQDKLVRVAGGLQKWGLFTATKPAA